MSRTLPTTVLGMPIRRVTAAVSIAAASSFLLFGYEFVRSVAQSLFVEAYGADKLPWVMAAAPAATLLLVFGYGRLLSAVGPRLAIILCTGVSAFLLIACQKAMLAGFAPATAILYLFREAYIVLLVEQVWSFLNSTLTDADGRKLNGMVCGLASLGPIAGGLMVRAYASAWGSANLLMMAALTLVPVGVLAAWSFHLAGEPAAPPDEARGRRGHLGWGELTRTPVLYRLALLIVLTQVVSTALELHMNIRVKSVIPDPDARTGWFGGLYALLNVGAALFQFVITPLALKRVSLKTLHTAIPILNGAGAVLSLAVPGLAPAAAAYMVFKTLDYSLFRAGKELLYIPLSFNARYRAKEVIDAFGYRLGKGAASALFAAVRELRVIPLPAYPLAALAALAAWIPLARRLSDTGSPARRT